MGPRYCKEYFCILLQLDLIEFDSDIVWPIFDALIHWCVTKCAEAKDPLLPGYISPRCVILQCMKGQVKF